MIAKAHRPTSWIYLAGTLFFGALMVLALVGFSPQTAQAAPPPKPVNCSGPSDALECDKFIFRGDTVKVKAKVGKEPCTYTLTAGNSSVISDPDGKDTGRAVGIVSNAKGKACAELLVFNGYSTAFDYTVKPAKGGGKK